MTQSLRRRLKNWIGHVCLLLQYDCRCAVVVLTPKWTIWALEI